MGYLGGIENYAEKHREYCNKILDDAKASLDKAGIKVFSSDSNSDSDNGGNVDSCVIIRKKQQPKNTTQPKDIKKEKIADENKNGAAWIREAMPAVHDNTSMAGEISNAIDKRLALEMSAELAKSAHKENGSTSPNSGDTDENIDLDDIDSSDIFGLEGHSENVGEMLDSNDDQGSGNGKLLRNYFETTVKKGFSSNNFVGSKFTKDNTDNTSDFNLEAYSDNQLGSKNEKTSIIFGGTFNATYMHSEEIDSQKDIDYNVYGYLKHKYKNFTGGAGAIHINNNGV